MTENILDHNNTITIVLRLCVSVFYPRHPPRALDRLHHPPAPPNPLCIHTLVSPAILLSFLSFSLLFLTNLKSRTAPAVFVPGFLIVREYHKTLMSTYRYLVQRYSFF